MRAAQPARAAAQGFTLIELLAVVAIFALLAGIALPNFGLRTGRICEEEAKRLASTLELARARAVATGAPHRVLLDLDEHGYWMEWQVTPARARGEEETALPEVHRTPERGPVPMAPPAALGRAFTAVAGPFGQPTWLPEEASLAGVETAGGLVAQGQVGLEFARDGTTDHTAILLADPEGPAWWLDLSALGDTVRLRREPR